MSDGRKRPGAVFWCAVGVAAVVFYVASFGPVCWLTSRTRRGARALPIIFRPITASMKIDPHRHADVSLWVGGSAKVRCYYHSSTGLAAQFATFWAAEDWNWRWVVEPGGDLADGHWEWKYALPFTPSAAF